MQMVNMKISNAHWSQLRPLRYTEMKRWLGESRDQDPVRRMYADRVSLYMLCRGYNASDLHNRHANWYSNSVRVVGH